MDRWGELCRRRVRGGLETFDICRKFPTCLWLCVIRLSHSLFLYCSFPLPSTPGSFEPLPEKAASVSWLRASISGWFARKHPGSTPPRSKLRSCILPTWQDRSFLTLATVDGLLNKSDTCRFCSKLRSCILGNPKIESPGPLPSVNGLQIRQILASGRPGCNFSGPGISFYGPGEIFQSGAFYGESRHLFIDAKKLLFRGAKKAKYWRAFD